MSDIIEFSKFSFLSEEQAKLLDEQLEKDFSVGVGSFEGISNYQGGGYVANLLNIAINFHNVSASNFEDYPVGDGIFPDFYICY